MTAANIQVAAESILVLNMQLLQDIQPVSMNILYHFSSVLTPELQWLSCESMLSAFRRLSFKHWLDLNILFFSLEHCQHVLILRKVPKA